MKKILELNADLIQTSCNKSHILGSILGVLTGTPVLWTVHDYISREHFSFPLRKLLAVFSFFPDRIIAFSEAVRRQFISEGAPSRKIIVIHHGIDARQFREKANGDIRKELDISEGAKVITVIGRLSYWKGQEYLIRAIPGIINKHNNCKFIIAGDAVFGEIKAKEDIKRLISDSGLTGCCIMTGWREDVPNVLKGTDILVHTSSRPEPFGLVLLEGMAMGKPVVASNAGGVVEIVEHGVTGLLVKPADSDAIAEAVIYLLSHPEDADRMGKAGKERVERFFDIKAMSKKIETVYEEIINRRGAETQRKTRSKK
ncbi:MAG: glycosyltransferase family 4 protein [Nitrospinae bacterium]|nr:glycosyltransferase family 4 protein [Nitrospinota bacterium]